MTGGVSKSLGRGGTDETEHSTSGRPEQLSQENGFPGGSTKDQPAAALPIFVPGGPSWGDHHVLSM